MPKDKNKQEKEEGKKCRRMRGGGATGAIYGLGFIGALVYFVQHATTFGTVILGILKAIVWPALLVFRLLEFFKM